jgi:hypothetical protein
MSEFALIIRDYRDEIERKWVKRLPGAVSDEYLEILASPLGTHILRKVLDDYLEYSDAEDFKVEATLRNILDQTAEEASRRAALGFELVDLLAGLQELRQAIWDALGDANVAGRLPGLGATLEQMIFVDEFFDQLQRAQVRGFLQGDQVSPEG